MLNEFPACPAEAEQRRRKLPEQCALGLGVSEDSSLDCFVFARLAHNFFFLAVVLDAGRNSLATSASCLAVGSLPLNSAGKVSWS